MNNRIRELADQCREEYPDTEWPDATHYRFDEAKFAKLIVKKCLDIVDNEGFGEGGSIRAMKKIKEHFGVEE